MQHISRIYIGNYGHKMCWYDGIVLSLVDRDTGLPCDHIIHLENGGGKSTLLGGIFSCFEPRQDRFLKTLHDPRNRFAEYFRDDGTPGFLVVEWQSRPEQNRAPRRMITGQAAAIKNTITQEMERVFFHFESNDELCLETLPFPKLCDAPVQTMRDFSGWLHRMQAKHRGNLYVTRNQNEWERNVEIERGIDIGLLKQQLEFSRQEGAVDAFLNFKTESEFLRKLLGLTMDQERAMSVRDSIALACDRLRDKPKQERRLRILKDCEGILGSFADTAHAYNTVRTEYSTVQEETLRFALGLEGRIFRRRQLLVEEETKKSESEANLSNQRQRQVQLTSSLLGARFEDLKRALARSKSVHESAKEEADDKANHIVILKAARSYRSVTAAEDRLQALEHLDADARKELKPFAQEANKAGSTLKYIIEQTIGNLAHKEDALKREASERRQEEKSLAAELKDSFDKRTALEKDLSKLEALEDRYNQERHRLLEASVFERANESVEKANARHFVHLEKAEADTRGQETFLENLVCDVNKLQDQINDIHKQHAQSESELRQVEQNVSKGQLLRAELSYDPVLCNVCDSETVDLELPELDCRLNDRILYLRQQADEHAVALAKLHSYKTEFESTGLAGVNPDVAKIMRRLVEGGVRSAISFSEYIAQVVPDVDQAQSLIGSNPARFLGVGLQDANELALAAALLPRHADVSQPVMISPTTHSVDSEQRFQVVLPLSDAAFNYEAAKQFAEDLSGAIQAETQHHQKCLSDIDDIRNVQGRVEQFLAQFGNGQQERMVERGLQLQNDLDSFESQINQLEAEIGDSKQAEALARATLKELAAVIQALERKLNELAVFATTVETPLMDAKERLISARSAIAELSRLIDQKQDKQRDLRDAYEEKILLAQRLNHEAENFRRELNEIAHYEVDFTGLNDTAGNITLDSARDNYRDRKRILETEEKERLGLLAVQIDNCRQGLIKAKEDYDREFRKLDPSAVLACLKAVTAIDECIAIKEGELAGLWELVQRMRDEWKLSESKFKDFKKANPTAEENSESFKLISEDGELIEAIRSLESELDSCCQSIDQLTNDIRLLDKEIVRLSHEIELLKRSHSQITTILDDYSPAMMDSDDSDLPQDPAAIDRITEQCTKNLRRITKEKETAYKIVEKRFNEVHSFAMRPEVTEAEAALSNYLTQNTLTDSIANAEELQKAIKQRISAVESILKTLSKDFEESLEELVNLVGEGIHVLSTACSKRLPENAPYIGGKPVLKMKASFPPSHADARRQVLSTYMNNIIESGFAHKTGTDMVSDAILQVAGGTLGMQIVKLIRDPSEQYVAVNKLSNSGGEAVSMAMFLYLLIARVRADMQAKIRHQVGGPLILDNPFAKATSSFIWRAQRDLARSLGVQLVIATALPDYNALGEFDHFIRLRKSGQNNKTGRWHIEQTEFSFVD